MHYLSSVENWIVQINLKPEFGPKFFKLSFGVKLRLKLKFKQKTVTKFTA